MILLTEKRRLRAVISLTKAAHKGQVDKAGEDYFRHLERVANGCKSISAKIVAYCHDIIEDGRISERDLWETRLITEKEMDAILLLTKVERDNKNFRSYQYGMWSLYRQGNLSDIRDHKLAREVKIQDLKDNMNLDRFIRNNKTIDLHDKDRVKNYAEKLAYLERQYER